MNDAKTPPSSGKTKIVLPTVNKPKHTDFRKDFKGQTKQKGWNAQRAQTTIRRSGPRGG